MKLSQVIAKATMAVLCSAGLVTAQEDPYLPWTICANQSTTCAQANVTFAYYVSQSYHVFACFYYVKVAPADKSI